MFKTLQGHRLATQRRWKTVPYFQLVSEMTYHVSRETQNTTNSTLLYCSATSVWLW